VCHLTTAPPCAYEADQGFWDCEFESEESIIHLL
jgi:hypothetical protein